MSETQKLARCEEMIYFYRTLAAVQTNAIFFIMNGTDETEMKERATKVSGHLEEVVGNFQELESARPCPRGSVWNPITGECE